MLVSDGLFLIATAIMLQTAAMLVPGPNMLLLAAASVGGFRTILTTAAGFAVAGTLFSSFSIALIRIPSLEQFGYTTFAILGILSGCYLLWIAFNLILSCAENFSLRPQNSATFEVPPQKQNRQNRQNSRCKSPFKTALFTNLANPKTLAFFVAIFGGMEDNQDIIEDLSQVL